MHGTAGVVVPLARLRTQARPSWQEEHAVRILLVEDDVALSDVLARGLREHAFAVDVAADGEAALYFAAINPYDAVVLDVALPRRDGLSVCRELRAKGSTTRILMLTARDAIADRIAGLDAGADDYLSKPFDLGELLARLRALMRRSGSVGERVLCVRDLELDTHNQTARRAGKEIALTTKEYALLEYLVRNADRVLGRREISEHVWDENYDPVSNLIESYINRLRRKIDDGHSHSLIRTRRGAGYVLQVTER